MRGVGSSAWDALWTCVLGGALTVALSSCPARSQEQVGPTQEIWVGADATASSWSVYSGMTSALFGSLRANGWRIRVGGGYGEYSYRGLNTEIDGTLAFAEALVGYHQQWGNLTVKAFAGVSWARHGLSMFDPENDVVGSDAGAKVILENWLEIAPSTWASLDLSAASAHEATFAARGRFGYRVWPELSLGPEAAASGGDKLEGWRVGGFARFAWERGEVAASAGFSDTEGGDGAYGTLNVLYKF